jgi:ornithine carbamoyltransferase
MASAPDSPPVPAPAPRHLLSLEQLNAAEFEDLLAVASYLKRRRAAGIHEHVTSGKTLAMMFEKPSLRTRLSFELAMTELGGHAVYIRGEEVGLGTREAVQDVARALGRYVHGIMARVFRHQTVVDLARWSGVPVINGLCDRHHPCQALADFLTIREHLGAVREPRVVFIGDANNVCRSLMRACVLGGARMTVACPPGYGLSEADRAALGAEWGGRVREVHDPIQAARGAHVLYTDVWTSMGQEAERAKRIADFQGYQVNAQLLALAEPEVKVMHCGPAHRGEEITEEAFEHPGAIIFDQAENRLHAQKAVLRLLLCPDAEAVVAAARDQAARGP